jgi:hypothetical protein
VHGDGGDAGVQALLGQFLTPVDDRLLHVDRGADRAVTRSPGPGQQALLVFGVVAADQFVHPSSGELVLAGYRTRGPALDPYRGDDQKRQGHRFHLQQRCSRCPETPVLHVLKL